MHVIWCFRVIVYCAAACKDVMRRHGAKPITVQLGALGAQSAKAVPGLTKTKLTLNFRAVALCVYLGIFIWHGAVVIPATDNNVICPQAGPIAEFSKVLRISPCSLAQASAEEDQVVHGTPDHKDISGFPWKEEMCCSA